MNPINAIDVMQSVDHFYNNAWLDLMIYVGSLTALIPLLSYFFQQRLFRQEEARLRIHIEKEVNDRLTALIPKELKRIEDETNARFVASETRATESIRAEIKKVERELSRSKAWIFHVQAKANITDGSYIQASDSLLYSFGHYLDANDKFNLRGAMAIFLETCLPQLDSEDLETSEKIGAGIEKAIKKLSEASKDGEYRDLINELDTGLNTAKKRKRA